VVPSSVQMLVVSILLLSSMQPALLSIGNRLLIAVSVELLTKC
jgi:hypothetical protein